MLSFEITADYRWLASTVRKGPVDWNIKEKTYLDKKKFTWLNKFELSLKRIIAGNFLTTNLYMWNISKRMKWRCDRQSCDCNLSNHKVSLKNVFGASTGFEPMASALALQCSTNWATTTHTLGAGQFIEFIIPVKGMKHMNIMWTFFGLTLQLLKSQSQLRWSHLHFIHMSTVHIIFIYLNESGNSHCLYFGLDLTSFKSSCNPSKRKRKNSWASCWLSTTTLKKWNVKNTHYKNNTVIIII